MAEPLRRDDAVAQALRESFREHMERARAATLAGRAATAPRWSETSQLAAPPAANDRPVARPTPPSRPVPATARAAAPSPTAPPRTEPAVEEFDLSGTGTLADEPTDVVAASRDLAARERPTPATRFGVGRRDAVEDDGYEEPQDAYAEPTPDRGMRRSVTAGALTGLAVVVLLGLGAGSYLAWDRYGPTSLELLTEFQRSWSRPTAQPHPVAQATTPPAQAAAPDTAPASPTAPVTRPAPTGSRVASAEPPRPASATHAVHTSAITLDAIDLAVQDAREHMAGGNAADARLILEPYRNSNDPRALFALAETYDPGFEHDPGLVDARQAQALYTAAGKAGNADAADRLSRLKTN